MEPNAAEARSVLSVTDGGEPATAEQQVEMEPQVSIDARGTRCPVPVNRLATAVEGGTARGDRENAAATAHTDERGAAAPLPAGTLVELLADDPNARVDVPVWCRLRHHQLLEVSENGDGWRFLLRTG